MVKHQVHEEFKTFMGDPLPILAEAVSAFARDEQISVKSLSVVCGPEEDQTIISIGYRRDEEFYPVRIEIVGLDTSAVDEIDDPGDDDEALVRANRAVAAIIDEALSKAENAVNGDVICHSVFDTAHTSEDSAISVAFLIHD